MSNLVLAVVLGLVGISVTISGYKNPRLARLLFFLAGLLFLVWVAGRTLPWLPSSGYRDQVIVGVEVLGLVLLVAGGLTLVALAGRLLLPRIRWRRKVKGYQRDVEELRKRLDWFDH